MASTEVLNSFKQIEVVKPVDIIIRQIKELISSGQLNPGDTLPSERKLSEKLNIGRSYVRDAISKLEFYGILKTIPQKGTVVAGIGIAALEGLISDVLALEEKDFTQLVETRVLLEVESAYNASQRRTNDDLANLDRAMILFHEKVAQGDPGIGEDFMFHLKVCEAGKNAVVKSLLMIISPEIMEIYNSLRVCSNGEYNKSYDQHIEIFEAIKKKDGEAARWAMRNHLSGILEFSKTYKRNGQRV